MKKKPGTNKPTVKPTVVTHVGQGMRIRGGFNINIPAMKEALEKQGREDREMLFGT
jgi:hypothetical protein